MITWIKNSIASILISTVLLGAPAVFAQEINCRAGDIDADNDGLIELYFLEDLNAVRYVLDGSGYKSSDGVPTTSSGCPATGCNGYELTRDLDFNTDASYCSTENKIKWTTTSTGGWLPIGDNDNRFSGTLNGNGYTLSGLTIQTAADYTGLLRVLSSSGTITGIGLLDVDVRGDVYVGSLVGRSYGTITESYSRGRVIGSNRVGGLVGQNDGAISAVTVAGQVSSKDRVGGLVGNNIDGIIINSFSTAQVDGTDTYAGGLVGLNWDDGKIFNSYSRGPVNGMQWAGGFVGVNRGTITNSYSRGRVSGSDEVGGLVGRNGGTIAHSYSRGPVNGTRWVGGLVGRSIGGHIRNSYSTGLVTGNRSVGGLVGENRHGATAVSNSYWDITTSEQLLSASGTSKTTVQLQAPTTASGIYSKWSEDDWYFGLATEYPAIKYTTGTDASRFACGTSQQPSCDSLLAGQGRVLIAISTQTPVRRADAMEGDIIVFKAEPDHSISDLTQIGDISLTLETINTAERRTLIPPNLVSTEAVRTTQVFQVEVNDGVDTHQTTVSVVVLKINNGRGMISIRQSGNDLIVAMSSPDPDGAAAASSISYQWQKCLVGEDCSDETSWRDTATTASSYSVVEAERKRNNLFRVFVRYRDGQGYAEEVVESIAYSLNPASSAPTFIGDWSEFEGGAIAVCNDADIDNDNDGLIEICYLEDLDAVRYVPDGSGYQPYSNVEKSTDGCAAGGCNGYELVRNLDFEADGSYFSTENRVHWTTDDGWIPILNFRGTFDGNGYTVSNLMIDKTSDNVGLFSSLLGGVIDEIGLLDVDVRGSDKVGSLVGENIQGHITNSYSSGSLSGNNQIGRLVGWNSGTISNSHSSGSVSGDSQIGGLVGWNGGTISNSHNSGSVSGEQQDAGGLVGFNQATIINSYSSGSVSGNQIAGGLVGSNSGGTISNGYSSGMVRSRGSIAGGLVGRNQEAVIINSYSVEQVSGPRNIGGLVGLIDKGMISNSYSIGQVSGDSNVGGLVGLSINNSTITASYWDRTTSRRLISAGGIIKTTVELQTPTSATGIYRTWSSDIWDFGTAIQYPALRYTTGTDAHNLLCGTEGQPLCGSLLVGQRIRHIALSIQTHVRVAAVEGETVALDAAPGYLTYRWETGDISLLSTTDTAELRFMVARDLVEKEATTGILTLRLTVSDGTASTTQIVHLVVAKTDNGLMSQPTITTSENRLILNLGTDPDGVATVEAYQWQRCLGSSATVVCSNEGSWENVSTSASYSLSAEDAVEGNRFRVRFTYTDGQGYRAPVTSAVFTYQEPVVPRRAIFMRLKLFLEGALQ